MTSGQWRPNDVGAARVKLLVVGLAGAVINLILSARLRLQPVARLAWLAGRTAMANSAIACWPTGAFPPFAAAAVALGGSLEGIDALAGSSRRRRRLLSPFPWTRTSWAQNLNRPRVN